MMRVPVITTLACAADRLLTEDGYRFEIRAEAGGVGYRLWISQHSQNSTLGGRPLVSSVFFSLSNDLTAAMAEIFAEVIGQEWRGLEAFTDADFARMIARIAADLAEDDA